MRDREERESEFVDKLVHINRVAKVVKGGRRFGFAALVVVGDQKGRVGFGHGKAREVPEAIRKATEAAKRGMIRVPLREGRTLHHDVRGRHGAGKVVLRSAPAGTGIIAGGPIRAVFETLGVQDVVAKSLGSSNPYNMVRAAFDALKREDSPRAVAARRGSRVEVDGGQRRVVHVGRCEIGRQPRVDRLLGAGDVEPRLRCVRLTQHDRDGGGEHCGEQEVLGGTDRHQREGDAPATQTARCRSVDIAVLQF